MGGIVMATTINAAASAGLVTTADTSTILQLQTNGITGIQVDASQKVTFANSLTSPTLVTPVINGMASSILTSGTAVASTSGTSIDFTGIPSWAKRITVMFSGVSTNGASITLVQLGSGSITTTGYVSAFGDLNGPNTCGIGTSTAGINFAGRYLSGAGSLIYGNLILTILSGNIWTAMGAVSANGFSYQGGGSVTLSGTLDRVRITTTNGTDTFDAGSINIMYE